jgi:hypothetical protein
MSDTANKTPLGVSGYLTRAFIQSPLTPLILLAGLAIGLIALVSLPREEEPQISVPMVDIFVTADGLKADDAVKLVTEPLETIVKAINGVEHVSPTPRTTVWSSPPASSSARRRTMRSCACTRRCAPTTTASRSASPSR